jgi:ParB family chromosome partitioning protein
MTSSKKKALGRGLDAILQSPETDITSRDISGDYVAGAIAEIEVTRIDANPFQPRTAFEEESLKELSQSIREQGVIQPLTVRKTGFDRYQLIAGERRLKAATMAGLAAVPCFIRIANDEQMLELALIENIHRRDLNAMEIAISYQRLMEELNLTQEEVSRKVGKERATVSNYIRLLKLQPEVQYALRHDQISMGHARALITITQPEKQLKVLLLIVEKGLSVRDAERLARESEKPVPEPPAKEPPVNDPVTGLQDRLQERFGTLVSIRQNNKGKGNIVIPFGSAPELNRILKLLDPQ